MEKKKFIISLLMVLCFLPLVFAETIVLKSGQTIEGKIIEQADEYIKVNYEGVPLMYFLDDVEEIVRDDALPVSKDKQKYSDTVKITMKDVEDTDSYPDLAAETYGDILRTVKSYFPQVKGINFDDVDSLSGTYSSMFRGGPYASNSVLMWGDSLYLYPDETYIYSIWTDSHDWVIHDKGSWVYRNKFLILRSDNTVPQNYFPKDNKYAPMYYEENGERKIRLMGTKQSYPDFVEVMKEQTRDPIPLHSVFAILDAWTFNKYSYNPKGTLGDYKRMKEETLEDCWHPEYFKSKGKK